MHRRHVTLDEYIKQIKLETIDKIVSRLCSVPFFEYVNGVKVISLEEALKKFTFRLNTYVPDKLEFCLIHGDLNFGNILVKNNDIKFIDPRGYFGELHDGTGPKEYDTAKLYFSLSGYDSFYETSDFDYTSYESSIEFTMSPVDDSRFHRDDFETALMVTIWLAASKYLEHEPNKMVASYYYGLYLATKYL
jgi:hypothetical protein